MRRLRSLEALLMAAIIAAVAILALRPGPAPGIAIERGAALPGVDQIRVDVSGAVARPAVVTVAPGARVIDAVDLAGGLAADADRAAVNLARRVLDQDHVVVPRLGEARALLDINRASVQQLEALPGIGPAYAAAIVRGRESGGAYASTDELVERTILPARTYAQIRDLLTAAP